MRTIAFVSRSSIDAALRQALETEGLRLETFDPDRAFSIVFVDLGDDTLAACRAWCERHRVICLLDDAATELRIAALEAGAADCVSRSISPRELVARIRNLIARTETAAEREQIAAVGLVAFAESMRVEVDGQRRDLTGGEAEILRILVERAPSPMSIGEIAALLPPKRRVSRETVASRMKSLRRKLGGRLVNRPGFGYQLKG